jgi:ADP-dependent NAD(P)H-hydrate dehydratase / NAD(P)H-hydrate epimerase
VLHHLPDAIIIGCPETDHGVMSELPDLNWSKYNAIAVGCGLTIEPLAVIKLLLAQNLPLLLDADALNILAQLPVSSWSQRQFPTIITPHAGEWRRLFPGHDFLDNGQTNRLTTVAAQAADHQLIILSKGARSIISNGDETWVINNGTPALARAGSGDVLTGLIGGLVANSPVNSTSPDLMRIVASAGWWHAQAGSKAAQERGTAGVDAFTLNSYLTEVIVN